MPKKRKLLDFRALGGAELDKEVCVRYTGRLTLKEAMETAEYTSTFRGGRVSKQGSSKRTLLSACVDAIGRQPEVILRRQDLWDVLPEHLKVCVRTATTYFHSGSIQPGPLLLEKLFIGDNMRTLNLDGMKNVSNVFLRKVHTTVNLDQLTFLSLVDIESIKSSAVASLLRVCSNLSYLNLKSCCELNDNVITDLVVSTLKELTYLNISYTRIGGPSLALIYAHCPKLATLKVAKCRLTYGHTNIKGIFPHPSNVLVNLKVRHCSVNQQHLKYLLEMFPNLQTFDCSSCDLRSIRPFITLPHESQLRKLNISNCKNLDLTKQNDVAQMFHVHSKLEHIYLTNAMARIPTESIANLRTLFAPMLYYPRAVIPEILEYGHNLTYLDLSCSDLYFHPEDYEEPLVVNVPNLRILSLQKTRVGDGAAALISKFHTLRSLFLGETAISALGLRVIVFACPWLEEVDLSGSRRFDVRERRTLLSTLRKEFHERMAEARLNGKVLDPVTNDWYEIESVSNGEEERDSLVSVFRV